jgi:hypothetical protein
VTGVLAGVRIVQDELHMREFDQQVRCRALPLSIGSEGGEQAQRGAFLFPTPETHFAERETRDMVSTLSRGAEAGVRPSPGMSLISPPHHHNDVGKGEGNN